MILSITYYPIEQNLIKTQEIIQQALEENKLDVVYHLLLSFENMTRIALPNTI